MLRRSGSADKEVRLWQMDPVAKTFNCTHTIEERFAAVPPLRRAAAPHSLQCVVMHVTVFYNCSAIILNFEQLVY